jgi:hypothetical protein
MEATNTVRLHPSAMLTDTEPINERTLREVAEAAELSSRETANKYPRGINITDRTPATVVLDLSGNLDIVGTNQLDAARQMVASLHFSIEQLQKACGTNLRHFEISYHSTLAVAHGLVNKAVSQGVEVSFDAGKMIIPLRSQAPKDIQVMKLLQTAWKLFMKACCALALPKAAQQPMTDQRPDQNFLTAALQQSTFPQATPQESSTEHTFHSSVDTAPIFTGAIQLDPLESFDASRAAHAASTAVSGEGLTPSTTTTCTSGATLEDEIDAFTYGMDELNARMSSYLARRDMDHGES